MGGCTQHHCWDTFLAKEVRTVTPETVVTSFKKREVSNALDGSEDAVVFEESAGSDSNNGVC